MLLRISDRYIIRSFLVSFVICSLAFISVFVVIETFSNLASIVADATRTAPRTVRTLGAVERSIRQLGTVIGLVLDMNFKRMPLIFYELAPVLIVSAAMFTISRLSRSNEITPLLASGVSIYRILWPIFLMCIVLTVLQVADRELVIPRSSRSLNEWDRIRARGKSQSKLRVMLEDGFGNVLFADKYGMRGNVQYAAEFTRYWSGGIDRTPMVVIHAQEAVWRARPQRGWLYSNGTIVQYDGDGNLMPQEDSGGSFKPQLSFGVNGCFVRYADARRRLSEYDLATDVTPVRFETEQVEMFYRPTLYLAQYARDHGLRGDVALELNRRIASPIGNAILLLLGLPFVLKRNVKSPFLAILVAIGITGAYFALGLVTANFALEGRFLTPLTGAWAPIIVFGPVGVLLFDTIES